MFVVNNKKKKMGLPLILHFSLSALSHCIENGHRANEGAADIYLGLHILMI